MTHRGPFQPLPFCDSVRYTYCWAETWDVSLKTSYTQAKHLLCSSTTPSLSSLSSSGLAALPTCTLHLLTSNTDPQARQDTCWGRLSR